MVAGAILGGSAGFAQFCFFNERQCSTLSFLLSLPVDPVQLVLAKYVSVFSMVLFTVNLPAVLIWDVQFLMFANAAALFLSAWCTAATVVSDKPWAPQLPMWIGLMAFLLARGMLQQFPTLLDGAAFLISNLWIVLTVIPAMAYISALFFKIRLNSAG